MNVPKIDTRMVRSHDEVTFYKSIKNIFQQLYLTIHPHKEFGFDSRLLARKLAKYVAKPLSSSVYRRATH